jgi:hypothetical protein
MIFQKKLIPFILFFIVANPSTFKLTRSVFGAWVAAADGLPTTAGLLLHALVFVILAHCLWRLIYGKKKSGFGGVGAALNANISEGELYASTNARGVQGSRMHPESFDDGADCQ